MRQDHDVGVHLKRNFSNISIFYQLHPKNLKGGDQGAEIGHFQDILQTYKDIEAY